MAGDLQMAPREAFGHGVEADRHGSAHDVATQRGAHADGVAAHQVLLQLVHLAHGDACGRELAEAGGDAVGYLFLGDDAGDDLMRPHDPLPRGAGELRDSAAARHGDNILDGESLAADRHSLHLQLLRPGGDPAASWPIVACGGDRHSHAPAASPSGLYTQDEPWRAGRRQMFHPLPRAPPHGTAKPDRCRLRSGPVAATRRSERRVKRGSLMNKLLGRYPRLALCAVFVASFVLASGAGRKWC